jgi:hypothetical protein
MAIGMQPRMIPAVLSMLALSGCLGTQRSWNASYAEAPEAVMSADLGGTISVSIEGRLWISKSPDAAQLANAQRRGVSHVIDLCRPSRLADKELAVECVIQNISYQPLNREESAHVSDPLVDALMNVLRERRGESILLVGEDMSTVASLLAVHRTVNEGVRLHVAIAEARLCGMNSNEAETFVRRHAVRLRNPLGS